MQNSFTLFRNDVKLSFVKTTKFFVQFSQTFNFQCRGLFKPYFRMEKLSIYAIFNAFPGPQKLSLTHSANKYIYKIFRKKNNRLFRNNKLYADLSGKGSYTGKEKTKKKVTKKKKKRKHKTFSFCSTCKSSWKDFGFTALNVVDGFKI